MAKPLFIELDDGRETHKLPIIYEDRAIMAIDKPAGWMLVPFSWQSTGRNLQAALTSSIAAGDFWAQSRNLKFLRFIHRLDADTTGILLLAKSMGAVDSYGELFESRKMEKTYLAVVEGIPREKEWTCRLKLGQVPGEPGKMQIDAREGKDAETYFRVLDKRGGRALVEAHPKTGRTHQIRVHLASAGCPVVGDKLYSKQPFPPGSRKMGDFTLALRSVALEFDDPFNRRPVQIRADATPFLDAFGFGKNVPAPAPAATTVAPGAVAPPPRPAPVARPPVPAKPPFKPRPPARPMNRRPQSPGAHPQKPSNPRHDRRRP
ncbi:MAG TPA: RluA family pseudouridine synthase [Roseimicrobium sp.]|nr:RluA family pseudouridine synthase [Roseimicrobium sp.]